MSTTKFDRDAMAKWYATQDRKTDPGIKEIYFLPRNSPPCEIRLIEVNDLMPERKDSTVEPTDFIVDRGMDSEHALYVLDVTPAQWDKIQQKLLPLPEGWSMDGAVPFQV